MSAFDDPAILAEAAAIFRSVRSCSANPPGVEQDASRHGSAAVSGGTPSHNQNDDPGVRVRGRTTHNA